MKKRVDIKQRHVANIIGSFLQFQYKGVDGFYLSPRTTKKIAQYIRRELKNSGIESYLQSMNIHSLMRDALDLAKRYPALSAFIHNIYSGMLTPDSDISTIASAVRVNGREDLSEAVLKDFSVSDDAPSDVCIQAFLLNAIVKPLVKPLQECIGGTQLKVVDTESLVSFTASVGKSVRSLIYSDSPNADVVWEVAGNEAFMSAVDGIVDRVKGGKALFNGIPVKLDELSSLFLEVPEFRKDAFISRGITSPYSLRLTDEETKFITIINPTIEAYPYTGNAYAGLCNDIAFTQVYDGTFFSTPYKTTVNPAVNIPIPLNLPPLHKHISYLTPHASVAPTSHKSTRIGTELYNNALSCNINNSYHSVTLFADKGIYKNTLTDYIAGCGACLNATLMLDNAFNVLLDNEVCYLNMLSSNAAHIAISLVHTLAKAAALDDLLPKSINRLFFTTNYNKDNDKIDRHAAEATLSDIAEIHNVLAKAYVTGNMRRYIDKVLDDPSPLVKVFKFILRINQYVYKQLMQSDAADAIEQCRTENRDVFLAAVQINDVFLWARSSSEFLSSLPEAFNMAMLSAAIRSISENPRLTQSSKQSQVSKIEQVFTRLSTRRTYSKPPLFDTTLLKFVPVSVRKSLLKDVYERWAQEQLNVDGTVRQYNGAVFDRIDVIAHDDPLAEAVKTDGINSLYIAALLRDAPLNKMLFRFSPIKDGYLADPRVYKYPSLQTPIRDRGFVRRLLEMPAKLYAFISPILSIPAQVAPLSLVLYQDSRFTVTLPTFYRNSGRAVDPVSFAAPCGAVNHATLQYDRHMNVSGRPNALVTFSDAYKVMPEADMIQTVTDIK